MFGIKNNDFIGAATRTASIANSFLSSLTKTGGSNKTGEIYRIWFLNDPTGKSYVGQTIQGSYDRIRQHIVDAERNDGTGCPLLDAATRRYGTQQMRYEILQRGITTREELDAAEQYWIKRYNSQAPNGYNVKSGGQGGGSVIGNTPLGAETRNKPNVAEMLAAFALSEIGKKYGDRVPDGARTVIGKLFR